MQRSLKLAQYLPALGIETHVLAPDDPKWVHRDPDLRVRRKPGCIAFLRGPKARKPAEELRAADGLERALLQARVTARRLLVPDASVTWNLTAIPAAIRIVRREAIDAVMTTSPPGSIHFVGAAVKQATGARWLADLRDPLVANQQRRADTPQPGLDKRRTSSSPGSSPAAQMRSHACRTRSREEEGSTRAESSARSRTAATSTTSRASSTGRRRGSDHARRKLREARPASVPAGAPRLRRRRARPVRRRLPRLRSRVGRVARARRPARADPLAPGSSRSASSATPRRCSS